MPDRTQAADKPFVQTSKKEHVDGVRPVSLTGEAKDTPLLGGVRIQESITIGSPVSVLYAFWREFENLPRFCKNLQKVEVLDEMRSRWTVTGPGDKAMTWDAILIEDIPDQLISWRSVEGSEFENSGSVRFRNAPTGRGTEVQAIMSYNPPAGPLGSLIAKLTAKDPAVLLREQLRRFKQLMETGEIPTTDGQPVVVE